MAATVNITAVKSALLSKWQAIAKAMLYNVAANAEAQNTYSSFPLTTSDASTDLLSFIDNGYTGAGANTNNDFVGVYSQITCAQFGACIANLNTWLTAPNTMSSNSLAILLNQLRILAGQPTV